MQSQQLIRGGSEPALRTPSLQAALPRLAGAKLLPPAAVAELAEAYAFLRRVENRLQMAEDAQTHALPEDAAGRARLAASMGFADWDAFRAALDARRRAVTARFDAVVLGRGGPGQPPPAALFESLWSPEASLERVAEDVRRAGPRRTRGRGARAARAAAVGLLPPARRVRPPTPRHAAAARPRRRRARRGGRGGAGPARADAAGAHHRGDRRAHGLSRAPQRERPGARAAGAGLQHGRLPGAAGRRTSAAARRAARRARPRDAAGPRAVRRGTRGAPRARRDRRGAAGRRAAPLPPRRDVPGRDAGPGRAPAADAGQRPPDRRRRTDPRAGAGARLAPHGGPVRRAALRRRGGRPHRARRDRRLRQARRHGTRLCLGPRPRVPARRRGPGTDVRTEGRRQRGLLPAARAAPRAPAHGAHARGSPVRGGRAPQALRQGRPRIHADRRLRGLPAARGLDLRAPGAAALALGGGRRRRSAPHSRACAATC